MTHAYAWQPSGRQPRHDSSRAAGCRSESESAPSTTGASHTGGAAHDRTADIAMGDGRRRATHAEHLCRAAASDGGRIFGIVPCQRRAPCGVKAQKWPRGKGRRGAHSARRRAERGSVRGRVCVKGWVGPRGGSCAGLGHPHLRRGGWYEALRKKRTSPDPPYNVRDGTW